MVAQSVRGVVAHCHGPRDCAGGVSADHHPQQPSPPDVARPSHLPIHPIPPHPCHRNRNRTQSKPSPEQQTTMRRALSLASLLLVGAAAALDGEKRGDFPMPYTLDEAFHNSLAGIKSEGQVSPFIVGGEVSRAQTLGGPDRCAYMYDPFTHTPPPRSASLRARGSSLTQRSCTAGARRFARRRSSRPAGRSGYVRTHLLLFGKKLGDRDGTDACSAYAGHALPVF